MSYAARAPSALVRICVDLLPRLIPMAVAGGISVVLGLVLASQALQIVFLVGGTTVLCLILAIAGVSLRHYVAQRNAYRIIRGFLENDPAPVVATDRLGRIGYRNAAALARFEERDMHSLNQLLGTYFAAPSTTLRRLMDTAARNGTAFEDRASRNGRVRLTVFSDGRDQFLWRLEAISPEAAAPGAMDLGLPLLVLDPHQSIIARNAALMELAGQPISLLSDLIHDLPIVPGGVHQLRSKNGLVRRRVIELEGAGGGRELYFLPAEASAGTGDGDQAQLFDTLPVPLLRVAANGDIELANRSAKVLLRSDIGEGTKLGDLVSGLGRSVNDWLDDAAAGRGLNRSEFLQVTSSETDLFVQVSLKRVERAGQTRLLVVLTDATELKTLEAQFVQSQKMQAIGQLAGGVAHDFNNLLTAISGHCDLLLLRHDQGDPDYGDLVQIHQNANRAASLVGQLLAFSRKQTLQPEVVDLRDALADLTHLLNRLVGERVWLTVRHDKDLPSIRADKRQLEQVIMNLVVNARDAMPEGGEITIETSAHVLKQEYRRNRAAIPAGDYVVVKVADQGVGILPEKLTKIFEPFYTTKKPGEGTGLGLSTAYGIIKQSGGFIFADSAPGKGTTFTLYFPVHTRSAEVAPAAVLPAPAKVETARTDGVVLLVEDEAPVRAFASRALRLRGLTVLEAENAESALEQLNNAELHVDVFVTDVVMPGMDGPSWVREALKARPNTPVVFVSGYAEDALTDHQERIPNSTFLPKPFSLQDLTATVQRQLH